MIQAVRYLFILGTSTESLKLKDHILKQLKDSDKGVEYDFYAASSPAEALKHVSLYCDLHPDIDTCFVSCGGDALTAGVAAGLMGAGEGKFLAVFDPEGAGGLARYYDGRDFGSIAALLAGSPTAIDMIRINKSYAVGACTFGLEGLSGAKGPGLMRSVAAILRRSFHSVRMTADGMPLNAGAVLFFTLANGRYAFGGLPCAPQARNDDGRLDLCVVRNMPPTRLMKTITLLEEGGLADDPSLATDLVQRRVKTLKVESGKDLTIIADGLTLTSKEFNIRLIPSAVRIVVPAAQ